MNEYSIIESKNTTLKASHLVWAFSIMMIPKSRCFLPGCLRGRQPISFDISFDYVIIRYDRACRQFGGL